MNTPSLAAAATQAARAGKGLTTLCERAHTSEGNLCRCRESMLVPGSAMACFNGCKGSPPDFVNLRRSSGKSTERACTVSDITGPGWKQYARPSAGTASF